MDPEVGKPLIFAFHGTGGDAHQLVALTQALAPGAGIVSPRGDVSEAGARRFFRRTGEGVYDMDDLALRTDKMIRFVEAAKAQHPGTPAFAYGYSNGANILASMVFQRPDLFERVGLLHPLIPWEPDPVAGLSGRDVLITAGARDPIAPWPMSATLIDWFQAAGANVVTDLHNGGHELRQSELDALGKLLLG